MDNTNEPNDANEEFYYDLDEAIEVVWKNIPQYLREKYEKADIYFILELEFNYLDSIGIMVGEDEESRISNYPVDINQDEMEKYIVTNSIQKDILLTYEELGDILDAELVYYDMHGAAGDMGEYLN